MIQVNREIRLSPCLQPTALDKAHVGEVRGALGTWKTDQVRAPGWRGHWRMFLAVLVLGPGLIVMVGDNDAGAFGTYTQAGQNYGTSLLWTPLLLVPVLYVNQETVLRLGSVTRVGHARVILERFGRFWGAFSEIDLFLLNGLTIVTEFIGVSLGLDYLGLPKTWGVAASAVLVMAAGATGNFRRFERFALALVAGSLILIPVVFMAHPPWGALVHDFVVPQLPAHAPMADVMLLIIAIVGTTVAPWRLFFQQSYVIDKPITTRMIGYERADLSLGILIVVAGAAAMMAFCAAAFAGTPEFGQFQDAGAVAATLVLIPGTPLGLLTNAVQTLAGVLLPSATVFLFLLCNDSEVLGPWVNSRGLNFFTGVVIGRLVTLSVILTAAVLFPDQTGARITETLLAGVALSVLAALASAGGRTAAIAPTEATRKTAWHMPPLAQLPPMKLSAIDRGWLLVLRAYLLVAVLMVIVRVIQLARHL